MKKNIKVILIVICIFVGIVFIDTLQAKVFNNSPIIKIRENYDGGTIDYKDIGIIVTTYKFNDGEKETVFKWQSYTYSPAESNTNTISEITNIDSFYEKRNYKWIY